MHTRGPRLSRERPPNARQCAHAKGASEILASIHDTRASMPADDPDAELPGVFVEQVQLEAAQFWREWKRVQRAAAHRVPVLLTRRRRSKWLIVIAAEDVPCLAAAVRAALESLD